MYLKVTCTFAELGLFPNVTGWWAQDMRDMSAHEQGCGYGDTLNKLRSRKIRD